MSRFLQGSLMIVTLTCSLGFRAVSSPAESEPVVELHRGFQVFVSERGEHCLVIGYEDHVDWVDIEKKVKALGGYLDGKLEIEELRLRSIAVPANGSGRLVDLLNKAPGIRSVEYETLSSFIDRGHCRSSWVYYCTILCSQRGKSPPSLQPSGLSAPPFSASPSAGERPRNASRNRSSSPETCRKGRGTSHPYGGAWLEAGLRPTFAAAATWPACPAFGLNDGTEVLPRCRILRGHFYI